MKKSERLNDMMIYLNGKKSFNLIDIISKYHISRSTALRDIQSLEQIGMPIYSQLGRNGYYGILPNRLLSPIVFSVDEVYALYFSMLTLNDYQTTPFHLSTVSLKNKFELCLSDDKINQLRKMESILRMGGIKHNNESKFLKEILTYSINNIVCQVDYKRDTTIQSYYVQFSTITSKFGQWYSTAYNFELEKPIVFRCDRILGIVESTQYSSIEISEIEKFGNEIYRSIDAVDYKVEITQKGVDTFHKENYPSMKLEKVDNRFYIIGYYNPKEEQFISNYFIQYGKQIVSIYPDVLKHIITKNIAELDHYYHQMNHTY